MADDPRIREWLIAAIAHAQLGFDPPPLAHPAADRPWRWANHIAFSHREVELVAALRAAGCRCTLPLPGYYQGGPIPRCRMCNVTLPEVDFGQAVAA